MNLPQANTTQALTVKHTTVLTNEAKTKKTKTLFRIEKCVSYSGSDKNDANVLYTQLTVASQTHLHIKIHAGMDRLLWSAEQGLSSHACIVAVFQFTNLVHTAERREVDSLAPHHTRGSHTGGVFPGPRVDHRVHEHLANKSKANPEG